MHLPIKSILTGSSMRKNCVLIFIFLLLLNSNTVVYSQQEKDGEYKVNTLDKKTWETLSEELDYSEEKKPKKEEPKPKETKEETSSMDLSGIAPIFQVIGVLLIIGIIGFILAKLLPSLLYKNSSVQKSNIEIDVEEDLLEENISEWPLEKLLKKYVTDGDMRNAIRIYYLMSLQLLHLNGLIKWEKDKTNSKYVIEFSSHPKSEDFSNLTRVYETTWYGNFKIHEDLFEITKNQFMMFNNQFRVSDEK